MHQPSDVIVLVDLVGTLSQSQKYLRIQSNVPVVLFGVIGLNDETSKQLDQSEQKTCTLQVMPLLLSTNSTITVEQRYNDPRYNDIPGITIDMLCPGKSYSKMYGTEPRYNDLRYNDIPDITMSF